MHRHKRFRHGPPLFRPGRGRGFGGLFWLIGLAILFSSGRWWPGILILVGLYILFGSLFREERPPEPPPYQAPPPFDEPPPPAAPRYAPPPVEPAHRVDLLPTNCPNCGGPVRSNDVRWTGPQSAACSYCGSNLPMKKQ